MQSNKLTLISEKDLKHELDTRLFLLPTGISQIWEQKIISYRQIDNVIDLTHTLERNDRVYVATLFFKNCTFNKEVIIGHERTAGQVCFDTCVFNENVNVNSLTNTEITGDCEFNKDLTISIENYGDKNISDLSFNSLTIKGTIGKLLLSNLNIGKSIKDQKLIFEADCKELKMDNIHFSEIKFTNFAKFQQTLVIESMEFNKLLLDRIELNSPIHLKDARIKKVEVKKVFGSHKELKITDNCIIGEIGIPLNLLQKIDISEGEIDSLKLTGTNGIENILNIQNVLFKNLIFEKVYNQGLITLRELNIIPKGTIAINSSNLGKTDFIYCDFSKAEFEFQNSKVTEIFLSETAFPKQVKINGEMNYPQAELAFGQLNTAFQKQGDTIRALEYQSREIEAHYYNLKNWLLPKLPFIDFDKVNLGLNKLSNNFGRSWIRGVAFTFLVGIISFYCLVISTNEYRLGIALDFKFEFVQSFLKFMNPIRFFELENLFKKGDSKPWLTLTWYSYIWDFLGRVFIAYGFYQTIQAFRRFGRR